MPRKKEFSESKVIDRAMKVFWRNGYFRTSARLLEKEMNINLFSIYSSFKNKDGVYLASLKTYKRLNREQLLQPLQEGTSVDDIKDYFINFLKFTKEKGAYKGCFLINTAQELGADMPDPVKAEINTFAKEIMHAFTNILSQEGYADKKVDKLTNYYFSSLEGLITSADSLSQQQIDDYLEIAFSSK